MCFEELTFDHFSEKLVASVVHNFVFFVYWETDYMVKLFCEHSAFNPTILNDLPYRAFSAYSISYLCFSMA